MLLNTWERLYLIQICNVLPQTNQFSAYDYRKLLQFIGKLELSKEEEIEVGFSETTPNNYTWKDSEKEFDLELSRNDKQILDKAIKQLKTGPIPFAKPESIVNLSEKLGLYDEEEANDES